MEKVDGVDYSYTAFYQGNYLKSSFRFEAGVFNSVEAGVFISPPPPPAPAPPPATATPTPLAAAVIHASRRRGAGCAGVEALDATGVAFSSAAAASSASRLDPARRRSGASCGVQSSLLRGLLGSASGERRCSSTSNPCSSVPKVKLLWMYLAYPTHVKVGWTPRAVEAARPPFWGRGEG